MSNLSWQLDQTTGQQPLLHKLRVFLLAVSGIVFVWLMLAICLEVIIGTPWLVLTHSTNHSRLLNLLLFLVAPAALFLASFRTQQSQPQGVIVDRRQVPQLFALLDELAVAFGTRRFQQVVLTSDFSITLHRSFQWVIGGLIQSELILGLPVLQALPPEELRAVLAREFARLCPKQRRLAYWLGGLYHAWVQVESRLNGTQHNIFDQLLKQFIWWYLARLRASVLPILRQDEFILDRKVAQLAGVAIVTSGLVNLAIKERLLTQEFWPSLYSHAYYRDEPPANLLNQLARTLKASVNEDTGRYYLWDALSVNAGLNDIHPCLHDRLVALGQGPEELPMPLQPLRVSAAQTFLNRALPSLSNQLSQDWQRVVRFRWKELYASAQSRPRMFPNLSEKSTTFYGS